MRADDAIAVLGRDPERTALLMDFDGSLADIVEHPEGAVPRPGVVTLLEHLAARYGRVGVVSGRPVAFLVERLPVPALVLVGQYGLERHVDGGIEVDPAVGPYVDAVAELADRADRELPGVYVERKGVVAVTLHWRAQGDRGDAATAWAERAAAGAGLALEPGRMAVELRPPLPVDKGTAVAGLAAGMAVAAFAGDDRGDLPAFAALGALAADGTLGASVRIGVRSPEAPPELVGATDLLVDGPAGLVELLSRLVPRG